MREAREVMEPVNTGSVPMPGDPRLAFYVDAIRLLETNDVRFLVGETWFRMGLDDRAVREFLKAGEV